MNCLIRTSLAVLLPVLFLAGCNSDHATLGRQRFEARDYAGAVEELTWAVEKNPGDGASRYLLGRAQAKSSASRFDAKATFRECRKFPEYRKPAARNLVQLLVLEKNFDAADAVITEELGETPGDGDWIETRGIVTLRRLDAEGAALQKDLKEIVGEGPSSWVVRRIGELRTLPDQATYDTAVRAQVEDLETRFDLRDSSALKAFAARSRAVGLQAHADFTAAAAKNPLAFRALTELGRAAANRDDVDEARKRLTAVIAIEEAALPDAESRIDYAKEHTTAVDLLSEELEQAKLVPEAVALLASERKKGLLPPSLEERLGRLYFENGQLEETSEVVNGIITRDPRNMWGNFLRGELATKAKKDEEAILYYNRALVLARMNPTINAALGRASARVGRLAQAEEHFGIALGNGLGWDVDVNVDYAHLLLRMTDAAQAAQYLENRLKNAFRDATSKEHQRILQEIRTLYESLGLKAGTLFEARNALTINPQNAFAKLAVARLEAAQNLPTIALARVREVTEEYPGLADAWILQAQILVDLRRGQDALPALGRAAALRPDDPNVPWIEGRVHLAQKRFGEARRSLGRALEIDPQLGGPRLDLAEVELADGGFQAAEVQARILVERFPDDPRAHRVLGLARLGLKDPQGAIAPLRRATASRPADPALRVTLAEALVETGAKKEAATELLAIAADAAIPRDARARASQALLDAGFFAEASDAFAALLASASTEHERADLSQGAFRAKMEGGNVMGALDELVRMRLSGRSDPADRMVVVAAQRAGSSREAAAQADLLRARDALDVESLEAAWRAHAKCAQWHKAIEDLNDLGRLQPERVPELELEQASAFLALGRVEEAARIAEVSSQRPNADLSKRLRVKLEIAAAGSDPAAIETALRATLAEASGDPAAPRLLAAKALAGLGRLELAAPILSAAPLRTQSEDDALLAAGILVAAGDPTGAAALLDANRDRGPRVGEARGLLAVVLDKTPAPDALLATFLDRLGRRDAAGTREAAARLREPESIRELWVSIARDVSGKADQAASAAQDLARARLYVESRLLADRAFTLVRGLAERSGAAGSSLDLLRAWWKLELGSPKAAADIAVPLLEREGRNAAVLLVASLAGIALAGPEAPGRLIDSPPPALPDAYLRDLARAAAAEGHHATALRAWSKLREQTDDDRVLRLLVAVERRDAKEALSVGKALSPEALARPALVAAKLWAAAQYPQTKALAESGIKALVALPRDLERVDLPLLFEAALAAGLKAEAAQILDLGLAQAGLSSERINRYADVLRRLRADPATLERLDERLALLDPSGKLRVLTPRKIET